MGYADGVQEGVNHFFLSSKEGKLVDLEEI